MNFSEKWLAGPIPRARATRHIKLIKFLDQGQCSLDARAYGISPAAPLLKSEGRGQTAQRPVPARTGTRIRSTQP